MTGASRRQQASLAARCPQEQRWVLRSAGVVPAPVFQAIDLAELTRRVNALRAKGVLLPATYPERNLDPSGPFFQGTLAQVETAELLAANFQPRLIRVEPGSVSGDVDIALTTQPAHSLQIKGLRLENIRVGSRTIGVEKLLDRAEADLLRTTPRTPFPTGRFTRVSISVDANGVATFGAHSAKFPWPTAAHVFMIEMPPSLIEYLTARKVKKLIRDANSQLPEQAGDIRVAVLNCLRFPADFRVAFLSAKDLLQRSPSLETLGGVLFVTATYDRGLDAGGFSEARNRLIGLTNPRSAPSLRMDPLLFNPNNEEETVYSESTIRVGIHPYSRRLSFHQGTILVDGIPFWPLPPGLSAPFQVRTRTFRRSDDSLVSDRTLLTRRASNP